MRFRTQVLAAIGNGDAIANQASATYTWAATGDGLTAISPNVVLTVPLPIPTPSPTPLPTDTPTPPPTFAPSPVATPIAPLASVDDSASTRQDTPVTLDVMANDGIAPGLTAELQSSTTPTHGSVTCTPQGSCIYTPNPGYVGADTFTYVIATAEGTRFLRPSPSESWPVRRH